jgi:hypothetical protein
MSPLEIPVTLLGGSSGTGRWCFHLLVAGTWHLWLIGRVSHQMLVDLLIQWRDSPLQLHKGTQIRPRNQLGALPIRLVRTRVQIIGLPLGGRRGNWSLPSRHPSNPIWDETLSLKFRDQAKVCETPPRIREVENLPGFQQDRAGWGATQVKRKHFR